MHSPRKKDSNKEKYLYIFVDSQSLNRDLETSNEAVASFLAYNNAELFKFIRSPIDTTYEVLKTINSYNILRDEHGENNDKVEVSTSDSRDDESRSYYWFPYSASLIEKFGKQIFNKNELSEQQKESITLVFIHSTFINAKLYEGKAIFVTHDRDLLKFRELIRARFTNYLDIMTVEKAMEFMDLFAKAHHKYYVELRGTATKGLWYWNSFRSKVPHYHVQTHGIFEGPRILEAFASRFTFLLMSVDEIGIQYYFPEDTQIMIPYHFNYFITLVTGIFDNLAIAIRDKYSLTFEGDKIPSRISLSSSAGKEFLKVLRQHSPALRSHIDLHRDFINLIYELRELAVHSEGFRSMGYRAKMRFTDFLVVDQNILNLIKMCGDVITSGDKISRWGVFHDHPFIFLEPYHFAKTAAMMLCSFSDRCLQLLGFTNFIDSLPPNDSYLAQIGCIRKYSLDRRN
jgi:hypothetical protein